MSLEVNFLKEIEIGKLTLKFMFFNKTTKFDEIPPSIWRYVVTVKSTVKFLSFFVAFLENMNFTRSQLE